jgi:hypothetical protein
MNKASRPFQRQWYMQVVSNRMAEPKQQNGSYETTHSKILLDDDVCKIISARIFCAGAPKLTVNGSHHESDLRSVCGASEVGVNLFRLGLVQ